MKVSLTWLKELVDIKLSPQELADKLSLTSIGVTEATDEILDLDLTYNRGDLLSLRGVAREIAAVTGCRLNFTADNPNYESIPTTPIQVEDKKLSPIEAVAKIEGLKVGPSNPDWIKKLTDSGIRSVNNIVDITNLIMLEFGQPLHSFDASSVTSETIIVRLAKPQEEIVTLDGKVRKLEATDIVLADTQKPLDVAGVMGGKDTEVKDSTNTILLSASLFNPVMIRRTSKRLGLASEASKRFEHGLTKTNLVQAFAAAIKMYESIGGKLTAVNIVGSLEEQPKRVSVSQNKINSLLGIEIDPEFIKSSLEALQFKVEKNSDGFEVTLPYFRLDINLEEDVIEEIARMYGYEKIAGQGLKDEKIPEIDQSFYNLLYDLKVACKEAGLTEIQTYSFYSTQVLEALGFNEQNENILIKVANPISAETEFLRANLWPNLVEIAAKNMRNGYKDIAIFEIGKVYFPNKDRNPEERYRLAIALSNQTDNPIEELAALFTRLNLKTEFGQKLTDGFAKMAFHPNRTAEISSKGKAIGGIAEVHKRLTDKFGIKARVAVLEIELEGIRQQN